MGDLLTLSALDLELDEANGGGNEEAKPKESEGNRKRRKLRI